MCIQGSLTEDREERTKGLSRRCTKICDDPEKTEEVQKKRVADFRRDGTEVTRSVWYTHLQNLQ